MRKALILLVALAAIRLLPRTVRAEARALGLFALLTQSLMTAANTSKAYATETRTANLENRVGALEQGNVVHLQPGTTIGVINHDVGVLVPIVNTGDVNFLAGLRKTQSPGGVGADPNSGGSWASGERANYINDLRANWNSLLGTFINNGFMNPA